MSITKLNLFTQNFPTFAIKTLSQETTKVADTVHLERIISYDLTNIQNTLKSKNFRIALFAGIVTFVALCIIYRFLNPKNGS